MFSAATGQGRGKWELGRAAEISPRGTRSPVTPMSRSSSSSDLASDAGKNHPSPSSSGQSGVLLLPRCCSTSSVDVAVDPAAHPQQPANFKDHSFSLEAKLASAQLLGTYKSSNPEQHSGRPTASGDGSLSDRMPRQRSAPLYPSERPLDLPEGESWFAQRQWVHANGSDSAPSTSASSVSGNSRAIGTRGLTWKLSVMCYNLLADDYALRFASKLYRDTPRRCLDWPARCALLLTEMLHYMPDVICLQEVQHFHDLEPAMRRSGYQGHFVKRTGRRRDGCAVFWRADRLRAAALHTLDFAPLGLEENVALLVSLAPVGRNKLEDELLCGVRFVVATTHITFDPSKGDVKLGQVRTMLQGAAQLMAGLQEGDEGAPGVVHGLGLGHHHHAPQRQVMCIVTGDFNSTAGSPLYQYLAQGSLDLGQYSKKKISGQLHGVCHTQYKPIDVVKQMHAQLMLQQQQQQPEHKAVVDAAGASLPCTPHSAGECSGRVSLDFGGHPGASDEPCTVAASGGSLGGSQNRALLDSFVASVRRLSERWSGSSLMHAMGEQYYMHTDPQQQQQRLCSSSSGTSNAWGGLLPAFMRHSAAGGPTAASHAMAPQPPPAQQQLAAVGRRAAGAGNSFDRQIGLPAAGAGAGAVAEAAGSSLSATASALPPERPVRPRTSVDLPTSGGPPGGSRPGTAVDCGGASLLVRHPLQLRSSYMEAAGAEPLYSSMHCGFMGTVDFIWYTPEPFHAAAGCPAGAAAAAAGPAAAPADAAQMSSQPAAVAAAAAAAPLPSLGLHVPLKRVALPRGGGPRHSGRGTSFWHHDGEQRGGSGATGSIRVELVPVAVLQPPELDALPHGLPAPGWGSDHVSIMTQFELRAWREL